MYNALPWWLTWIDGRVILLLALIGAAWLFYWMSLNTSEYNDQDRCVACDAHISEPHDTNCVLDQGYDNE